MLAESFAPVSGRPRAVLLAAAVALLLGGGCRREGGLAPSGTPVILISVDTLRADHLPAYGYRGVDTPNLDALRRTRSSSRTPTRRSR